MEAGVRSGRRGCQGEQAEHHTHAEPQPERSPLLASKCIGYTHDVLSSCNGRTNPITYGASDQPLSQSLERRCAGSLESELVY